MTKVLLRKLGEDDAAIVARIFFHAVHEGTKDHYTTEQRLAWGGDAPDPEGWRNRIRGMTGFVAEAGGEPAGFMTIDADGLIDLAFVAPDFAGLGLGYALYKAVEQAARELRAPGLHTEASLRARPFFERQGFHVVEAQTVVQRGVEMRNFKMRKALWPGKPQPAKP